MAQSIGDCTGEGFTGGSGPGINIGTKHTQGVLLGKRFTERGRGSFAPATLTQPASLSHLLPSLPYGSLKKPAKARQRIAVSVAPGELYMDPTAASGGDHIGFDKLDESNSQHLEYHDRFLLYKTFYDAFNGPGRAIIDNPRVVQNFV